MHRRKDVKKPGRNAKRSGLKAFSNAHASQFGTERWLHSLLPALKRPTRHCALFNTFSRTEKKQLVHDIEENLRGGQGGGEQEEKQDITLKKLSFSSVPCYALDSPNADHGGIGMVSSFPRPGRDEVEGSLVMNYYLLDAASVLMTEALNVQPNDAVLDLCAAPGGKSVSLLQRLNGPQGSIHCNEFDGRRRKRLENVLQEYLPMEIRGSCVSVTGFNGTVPHFFKSSHYDRVLLDAPCSSDRHLVHDLKEMAQWTPQLAVQMSQRQFQLLMTALRVVKPGGYIAYGTCALSKAENDDVISKALSHSHRICGIRCEIAERREWTIGERTTHGWLVLPDTSNGWGPLYFAILRRVPDSEVSHVSDQAR